MLRKSGTPIIRSLSVVMLAWAAVAYTAATTPTGHHSGDDQSNSKRHGSDHHGTASHPCPANPAARLLAARRHYGVEGERRQHRESDGVRLPGRTRWIAWQPNLVERR